MSLDAVTIVGLILGIVGLWGLPTLWTRALYVGRKLNALPQSSKDLSRQAKFHVNEPSSTHALRANLMTSTTGHQET